MYSLSMAPYSDNFTSQTIIKESSVHRSLLHYKTGYGRVATRSETEERKDEQTKRTRRFYICTLNSKTSSQKDNESMVSKQRPAGLCIVILSTIARRKKIKMFTHAQILK